MAVGAEVAAAAAAAPAAAVLTTRVLVCDQAAPA
jgi:hypothetical protein